jgi:hypothetical protein
MISRLPSPRLPVNRCVAEFVPERRRICAGEPVYPDSFTGYRRRLYQ